MPASLDFHLEGFHEIRFPDTSFTSIKQYDQLLLSRSFYEPFRAYEFILIYQLDCLVFFDALEEWCERDYDYIGAPWFQDKQEASLGLSRVGNGGFSLRRVQRFLDVIDSIRYTQIPVSILSDFLFARMPDLVPWPTLRKWRKRLSVCRSVRVGSERYRAMYTMNEDHFWSDRARLFLPHFSVAPVSAGLAFAFENHPATCYELNHRRLPFGAHAWERWGREFWVPFLDS